MGIKRKYDWKPDLPDKRDWKYDHKLLGAQELPPSIDLRSKMPPVVDQGQIGSCTANAIAGAIGFLELMEGPFDPISRLFIYWNERTMEGNQYQDAGAEIRDGILSVRNQGVCRETTWPYSQALLFQAPTQSAFVEASNHKIVNGFRLDNTNIESLKACLANGYPITFGFTVYDSFESQQVEHTGIVPMPNFSNERVLGGHAVLLVGYDDSAQMFLVRNSWGAWWGQAGYCWMPYSYLTDLDLSQDFWTLMR